MSPRDRLFSQPLSEPGPFVFDARVAAVFPDMVRRSVPGYENVITGTGLIAGQYAQAHTRLYDLGCSTGASTLAMSQHVTADDCRIIAVDNSADMITACARNLQQINTPAKIETRCNDIQDVAIENASVIALNYTLQFIPPGQRGDLLTTIRQGMISGGVLILSEKLAFDDEHEQQTQTALHEAFKRAQGYSELEISQKRTALENVLIPETLATHHQRLSEAGFIHIQTWFRCLNFVSMLAFSG